jgi:hypothetical protein
MNEGVSFDLSGDLALVLLALIGRLNEQESIEFVDQAEQRAMWDLEALLESAVAATVAPDFEAEVRAARDRLRDTE